jgi:protein SCO1/2
MSAIVSVLKDKSFIIYLVLFSGCMAKQEIKHLPYYNTPDFTPHWINNKEKANEEITHRIGDFNFTDQEGNIVNQKTINGKIYVANFFFSTCSSICPRMMLNLQTIQKKFKKNNDVTLLSYSVTPWIDSVQRLRKYADKYNIEPGKWHLLTGSTSAIYTLARQSYFAEEETGYNKDSSEFLHTEHFILVDKQGYIRGIYNGTLPLETERLAYDINLLLKED